MPPSHLSLLTFSSRRQVCFTDMNATRSAEVGKKKKNSPQTKNFSNSKKRFSTSLSVLHLSNELLLTLPALICPADKWPPAALCACMIVCMRWCVRALFTPRNEETKGGTESLMSRLTERIHVSLFLPANTCCSGWSKILSTHTYRRGRGGVGVY